MKRNSINIYVCSPVRISGSPMYVTCLYFQWGLQCQSKCPFMMQN